MKKLSITICGLTLALFLVCGESAPAVSAPLTSAKDDTEYALYSIYELLESGLLNESFNLYKLRNTFLSGQLVLCVPVVYTLQCVTESECTWDFNCTSNFTRAMPFLWTLFSTQSHTGKLLLYFTKNRLRSPLLGLFKHKCSFSLESSISLYLKVETFPCFEGNVSVESLITNTLIKITGLLKDYALSNGYPTRTTETVIGHGLSWTEDVRNQFFEETNKSEYYIPLVMIAIAFFVGITGSFQALKFVRKTVNEKNTSSYYWFWSSQILAVVVNAMYIVYTIKSASHAGQTYIIVVAVPLLACAYATLFILGNLYMPLGIADGDTDTPGRHISRTTYDSIGNVEVNSGASTMTVDQTEADGEKGTTVKRKEDSSITPGAHTRHADIEAAAVEPQHADGEDAESDVLGIQVVCTGWPCCSTKRCYGSRSQLAFRTSVVIATAANTFVFTVNIMYTFSWVILGFYLYPIKMLVRISFVIAAALCLTLNLSVILRYLELLTSLCCSCPCCPCCGTDEKSNNQDTPNTGESELEVSISQATTSGTNNPKKRKKLHIAWKQLLTRCASTAVGKKCCSSTTILHTSKSIRVMFKFITSIVVLVALIYVGFLLYHITFIFSSDVDTTVQEVLTILPTVVISLSVYFLRGRLSYEGELKSILSVLTPHKRRKLSYRRRSSQGHHQINYDDSWEELPLLTASPT